VPDRHRPQPLDTADVLAHIAQYEAIFATALPPDVPPGIGTLYLAMMLTQAHPEWWRQLSVQALHESFDAAHGGTSSLAAMAHYLVDTFPAPSFDRLEAA
jgi:hypothetical protein